MTSFLAQFDLPFTKPNQPDGLSLTLSFLHLSHDRLKEEEILVLRIPKIFFRNKRESERVKKKHERTRLERSSMTSTSVNNAKILCVCVCVCVTVFCVHRFDSSMKIRSIINYAALKLTSSHSEEVFHLLLPQTHTRWITMHLPVSSYKAILKCRHESKKKSLDEGIKIQEMCMRKN
jgi:hypothetical protein